jgi:hypothetical protein
MPTNKYARIGSNALVGSTLTNATHATGAALETLARTKDGQQAMEAWFDDFVENGLEDNQPNPGLQTVANMVANLLPQTKVLKILSNTNQLLDGGGIGKKFSDKLDIIRNKKKFKSEEKNALSKKAFDELKSPKEDLNQNSEFKDIFVKNLTDGRKLFVDGVENKGGDITYVSANVKDKNNHTLTNLKLGPDNEGLLTVNSNFANNHHPKGFDYAKFKSKNASRESREALAELFGGIGSDKYGRNSSSGISSYYHPEDKSVRTFPENLEDNVKYNSRQDSRFFTAGTEQQRQDFLKATKEQFSQTSDKSTNRVEPGKYQFTDLDLPNEPKMRHDGRVSNGALHALYGSDRKHERTDLSELPSLREAVLNTPNNNNVFNQTLIRSSNARKRKLILDRHAPQKATELDRLFSNNVVSMGEALERAGYNQQQPLRRMYGPQVSQSMQDHQDRLNDKTDKLHRELGLNASDNIRDFTRNLLNRSNFQPPQKKDVKDSQPVNRYDTNEYPLFSPARTKQIEALKKDKPIDNLLLRSLELENENLASPSFLEKLLQKFKKP